MGTKEAVRHQVEVTCLAYYCTWDREDVDQIGSDKEVRGKKTRGPVALTKLAARRHSEEMGHQVRMEHIVIEVYGAEGGL